MRPNGLISIHVSIGVTALVAFIDGNDVIQEVAAAAAHPALRNTVLPRTFEGSPDRTHP
jgi:hypothetical protein